MKILQIAPVERSVPPRLHGGIERVVHNLVEGLTARGNQVTLLASGNSQTSATLYPLIEKPLLDDKTRYADLKSREAYFSVVVAKVLKYLKGQQFDIVHNHLGWRILPFWTFIGSPFLTTLQTPLTSRAKETVFEEAKRTPIVSVSRHQQMGNPVLNYVANIYNGIDLSLYDFGKGDGGYLVFLGRMAPEKGPLEAIRLAQAVGKPLIMAAAVHPWEAAYFQHTVSPHIDQDMITFIGEVDDQKKNELLGGAEALLNPIQWEEPFGIATVEAMACGTPVVTLRRGAMPEIVTDGVTGILGSCLEELIDRFDEVCRLNRAACRAQVEEKFTSDQMVENYLKVYSAL